ncbi:pyridoxamine 5'-phosphate oxidase-related FMN-binding protein [Hungatella hathewayi]|uniref:Pyridoxamine 5'-phosphate oxidase-related FMN-binding protein n=2 Tax=Lachnospiraceae TaxID=186803 RepID=A0A174BZ73_9FIRM|nr:pyridoxamine 5'-phosphate oxidase-related FMN-binding protein [Hungatella hathewayi]
MRVKDFMRKFSREAEQIMIERFGKDTIIALATTENATPYVRYVNAYYEDGAFYIITHALSNKMKHIKDNSVVAIAGEWFTAHGKGVSLGYFRKKENCVIAEKLKKVFAEWIDNGHTDFDDENTIILRVELTDGLLLSHGTRYEF